MGPTPSHLIIPRQEVPADKRTADKPQGFVQGTGTKGFRVPLKPLMIHEQF
jgi:hypothetical protein